MLRRRWSRSQRKDRRRTIGRALSCVVDVAEVHAVELTTWWLEYFLRTIQSGIQQTTMKRDRSVSSPAVLKHSGHWWVELHYAKNNRARTELT